MSEIVEGRKLGKNGVIRLNENERKVLTVLVGVYNDSLSYCLPFTPIEMDAGLSRREVRRACRSLKRKGLAKFCKGLWTEDGEPAGSGYCATKTGAEVDQLSQGKAVHNASSKQKE